jgi:hypothetical protein
MGPLLLEITTIYKNDPNATKKVPELIQAELLRQICAQNPAAESVDLAKAGKTSVLLLVTYPNGSHAGYSGGTVVDDLQDDLERKQTVYRERYGVTDENLVTAEVEHTSEEEIFALIDQEIQRAIDLGQEEFVLEYSAHGIAGGVIRLGDVEGFSGTVLAQHLAQYADRIKITVVSHTCRGAWQLTQMQEVFAQNPNLKGVTIYTASDFYPEKSQFKPEEQLLASKYLSKNIDNPFDYYFSLAFETDPTITYAQARLFASWMTKEQFSTSPLCITITASTTTLPSSPYNPITEFAAFQTTGFQPTNPYYLSNLMNVPAETNPGAYNPQNYAAVVTRVY